MLEWGGGWVWVGGGGVWCCFFFFFFKQKTAYEMCGRDWSSDVCSSDLWSYFLMSIQGLMKQEVILAVTYIGR